MPYRLLRMARLGEADGKDTQTDAMQDVRSVDDLDSKAEQRRGRGS